MDNEELDMIPACKSTWLHSGIALQPFVVSTKSSGHSGTTTLEFGWCLENKAVCMEMLMRLRKGDEKNSSQLIQAG